MGKKKTTDKTGLGEKMSISKMRIYEEVFNPKTGKKELVLKDTFNESKN